MKICSDKSNFSIPRFEFRICKDHLFIQIIRYRVWLIFNNKNHPW